MARSDHSNSCPGNGCPGNGQRATEISAHTLFGSSRWEQIGTPSLKAVGKKNLPQRPLGLGFQSVSKRLGPKNVRTDSAVAWATVARATVARATVARASVAMVRSDHVTSGEI